MQQEDQSAQHNEDPKCTATALKRRVISAMLVVPLSEAVPCTVLTDKAVSFVARCLSWKRDFTARAPPNSVAVMFY